jgi:hypothetical protein
VPFLCLKLFCRLSNLLWVVNVHVNFQVDSSTYVCLQVLLRSYTYKRRTVISSYSVGTTNPRLQRLRVAKTFLDERDDFDLVRQRTYLLISMCHNAIWQPCDDFHLVEAIFVLSMVHEC